MTNHSCPTALWCLFVFKILPQKLNTCAKARRQPDTTPAFSKSFSSGLGPPCTLGLRAKQLKRQRFYRQRGAEQPGVAQVHPSMSQEIQVRQER